MNPPNHPQHLKNIRYLGDGLYVGDGDFQVMIYSHNGIEVLDAVYMDPEVIQAFINWLEKTRELKIIIKKAEK